MGIGSSGSRGEIEVSAAILKVLLCCALIGVSCQRHALPQGEELPPTFDFDMHRVAFVSTVWLIYTTVLVRFALGRWGTMQPSTRGTCG